MGKNTRICGTVKGCDPVSGWCVIDGDDEGEYTANILEEECGALTEGQRVDFEPIGGSMGPFAVDIVHISDK